MSNVYVKELSDPQHNDWKFLCESYDYHQNVARASFGDMVHDHERNQKYNEALTVAINKHKSSMKKVNVLDIGTGTGLLSMMAVSRNADTVVACEGFRPMADCAERIIQKNGMGDKIKIIKKRSTDIQVGPGMDMECKANILVTEVFDTDLIGEDAISIFQHAHKYLLEVDCIVVPHLATVYVQLIQSPLVSNWDKPKWLASLDGDIILKTPSEIEKTLGSSVSHDIQLSQLPLSTFTALTNPEPIFDFDFSGKTKLNSERNIKKIMKAINTGTVSGLFVWWDLKMDINDKIILSCAPYWAHPDLKSVFEQETVLKEDNYFQNIPWRDHWMQAVYYFRERIHLKKDDLFTLFANHNDYVYWFDLNKNIDAILGNTSEPQLCDISFYAINSRTRIGQINDNIRNKKYLKYYEDNLKKQKILAIGDGSLVCLASCAMGPEHVYLLQENFLHKGVIESFANENNLKNVSIVSSLEEITNLNDIDHIIGEPFFSTSILPWDNFLFGNIILKIKNQMKTSIQISPFKATVFAMPVQFLDLQKIRLPVINCEGFDMSEYDKLLNNAFNVADDYIEAQPLWEYPCKATGKPLEIITVDFNNFNHDTTTSGQLTMESSGTCNGIAMWVDWYLDKSISPKTTVSSGPINSVCIGDFVKWDMYTKQGVHLFPKEIDVKIGDQIGFSTKFIYEECKFTCYFKH